MTLTLLNIKKKTLPVVWLLVGLMAIYPMAQHAWSGIVLCIGADGHIEIEDGRASDCATEIGKAASETHYDPVVAESEVEEFEDCGPCVDVALLISPYDGQSVSKIEGSAEANVFPRLAVQSILINDNQVSARLPNSPETAVSHFFTPLRTVALLL